MPDVLAAMTWPVMWGNNILQFLHFVNILQHLQSGRRSGTSASTKLFVNLLISPHGIAMPRAYVLPLWFLLFFRRLISEITERISTKLGHIYHL